MAEYFRDEASEDVPLFIDNIFRFTQAWLRGVRRCWPHAVAVGYQPTLADEMGQLQERMTSTHVVTPSRRCRPSTCPRMTTPTCPPQRRSRTWTRRRSCPARVLQKGIFRRWTCCVQSTILARRRRR